MNLTFLSASLNLQSAAVSAAVSAFTSLRGCLLPFCICSTHHPSGLYENLGLTHCYCTIIKSGQTLFWGLGFAGTTCIFTWHLLTQSVHTTTLFGCCWGFVFIRWHVITQSNHWWAERFIWYEPGTILRPRVSDISVNTELSNLLLLGNYNTGTNCLLLTIYICTAVKLREKLAEGCS